MHALVQNKTYDIEIFAYTLDQFQPDWDDSKIRAYLESQDIPDIIEKRNTYSVVIEKVPAHKTYYLLSFKIQAR